MNVAIAGGGPGGLLTAKFLEDKFKDACRITLFEACGRTGGKIVTCRFDSVPVIYEAGAAELYDYSETGPDPLRQLVRSLGLKTVPMQSRTVVLDGRILRNRSDIRRLCGRDTLAAIDAFRRRCAEALTPTRYYEGSPHFDNAHPWARRSCAEILNEVPDATARKYLRVAVHSDLATEPHLTNGLNGLKNFLMDVPGYMRIYSIDGGNEMLATRLRERLTRTRIETGARVTRIERNADDTYRLHYRRDRTTGHGDFDAVFAALPHNWLGAVEWGGEQLERAMARHIAYYDRPAHYLRVSTLFREPFWRDRIPGSWFMLDAFGGCCVYDEGARHDVGEYGVLSWLIAGGDALSLNNPDDATLTAMTLDSLPEPLADRARTAWMETKVHRWMASVNALPGGFPVEETRRAHLPEPEHHAGLFLVGDYLFDSTLNGTLDSADLATDLFQSWMLKRDLVAGAPAIRTGKLGRDYFDDYHEGESYAEAYDWYFDAKYVRDLIGIVWKTAPPYRLLDAGSASGLTLAEFADCGIEAWGAENNRYIHSQTPHAWRKRNRLADVTKLPFPDDYFDFSYETCLSHIPEKQIGRALSELRRVTRRGVIFGSITSDMNPHLLKSRGLVRETKLLLTLWEWGDLFQAHGFDIAVNGEKSLERVARCEKKYNEGDEEWYPDRDSLRYCFYNKVPRPSAN